MTDSMLDVLLDSVREPTPLDDEFVAIVMRQVRNPNVTPLRRWSSRHPVVLAVTAAVIVTGGAVAAVVRSVEPTHTTPQATLPLARPTTVVAKPAPARSDVSTSAVPLTPRSSATDIALPNGSSHGFAWGFESVHHAYVIDSQTGLKLETESYRNVFAVGAPDKVTLTLTNTSSRSIGVSGQNGCGLQVVASPNSGASNDPSNNTAANDPEKSAGSVPGFQWKCAGTGADPRKQGSNESFVLGPGETKSVSTTVVLDRAGDWEILGMCRCSYSSSAQAPEATDLSNPVGGFTRFSLPSPLIPSTGTDATARTLVTPPIRVRAQ